MTWPRIPTDRALLRHNPERFLASWLRKPRKPRRHSGLARGR